MPVHARGSDNTFAHTDLVTERATAGLDHHVHRWSVRTEIKLIDGVRLQTAHRHRALN
jgi:hypothetical protein